jgi:hypothetical protein
MQEATEEKKIVDDKKPDAPKRKNTKRKYLAEAEEKKEVEPIKVEEKVEKKVEEPKVEQKPEQKAEEKKVEETLAEEPQPKRVRVTQEDPGEEEEPSFFRGGLVKPLLLAGIASASFFVNNMYRTTVVKPSTVQQAQKKKVVQTMPKYENFMLQSKIVRRSIVPGFTQ